MRTGSFASVNYFGGSASSLREADVSQRAAAGARKSPRRAEDDELEEKHEEGKLFVCSVSSRPQSK